jgi:hypothetical protein
MSQTDDPRRIPLRRWVGCGVVAGGVVIVAGLLIVFIDRSRALAAKVGSQNNLRALSLLGTPYTRNDLGAVVPTRPPGGVQSVWPGTVMNAGLAPAERLSWVVHALPMLSEPALDMARLVEQIDQKEAWNRGANEAVSRTVLRTLQCPGWPVLPETGEPAVTMYVGIAGVGPDAAELQPTNHRAGAFRYDAATSLATISNADGLSSTLLFGVTRRDNGPWIRGGPATLRPLLAEPDAGPLVGPGGQFGGTLAGGTWFALCDGSVRWFSDRTPPAVLLSMATIAAGTADIPTDE